MYIDIVMCIYIHINYIFRIRILNSRYVVLKYFKNLLLKSDINLKNIVSMFVPVIFNGGSE